jgi:hypothetical protein
VDRFWVAATFLSACSDALGGSLAIRYRYRLLLIVEVIVLVAPWAFLLELHHLDRLEKEAVAVMTTILPKGQISHRMGHDSASRKVRGSRQINSAVPPPLLSVGSGSEASFGNRCRT